MNIHRISIAVLAACLLLAGCREPVLTSRPEDEANAALATLARAGVSASKQDVGRGAFSVLVARRDLEHALEVLSVAGLPRTPEPGLADLFPEPGLVSSTTEQRARYHLALASELGASLRRVSGVRDARVHLGLPTERPRRLDRGPEEPAKASVLLLAEPGEAAAVERRVDAVRHLVAGAVAGLAPDAVSVVVTEAHALPRAAAPAPPAPRPAMLATGAGAILSGLALACFFVVRRLPGVKESAP